jgi:MSHA biogenesis protein MshJ
MTALLFRLRLLIERFSVRERVMILLCLVLLLASISYGVQWSLGWTDNRELRNQITTLETQTTSNQNTLLAMEQMSSDPQLQTLVLQNERLREQIRDLDDRISGITDILIPPDTMANLLRELLGNTDMTLVSFRALPSQPVAQEEAASGSLYRHRLDIELTGSFSALTQYLQTIEGLPWRLFWDELSVETRDYPILRIRLKVHTLSDQEAWLNV